MNFGMQPIRPWRILSPLALLYLISRDFLKNIFFFIERRLVQKHEFPLMLQVKIGPHEDVAKFQVMELKFTSEIR